MKRIAILGAIHIALCSSLFSQPAHYRWTIDEVFRLGAAFKSFQNIQWVDGGKKFSYFDTDTTTKQRNLYLQDVWSGKKELVMDVSALKEKADDKPIRVGSYEWSADGANILVTGTLTARATKTGGSFGIYNRLSKSFRMVSDAKEEQAIIKLSPDGKKVGFVRGNNLFVMDVASRKEVQLTFDGSETILNGKFDWVYEEEFSIIDGWYWSPDSKRIAFWRLDQTHVPTFPLVSYSMEDAHASVETMRYPKAGDKNSLVQIGVANVEDKSVRWLDLGTNPDIYIPRVKWTNNPNILSVQRLNRGQDTLQLMLANVTTGAMKTILTETDSAWLEVERDDAMFLNDGKRFVWVAWRGGFTHIYLYALDGKLERQVTKGPWDVSDIVGVDEQQQLIYFIAGKESPLERHLYSIRFDGSDMRKLTSEAGWHSARFSPDMKCFIHTFSSAQRPSQVWMKKADGGLVRPLVENTLDAWKGMPVTEHSFFTFTTPDGVELNGYMLKPANFDASKKYPVLMYVYGAGPQTVTNRWGGRNYLWYQLLAERGYIIASIDPRGTDARGKSFRQTTNRELGYKNTLDIIEAAKYLGTLSYIDASRIGVWGWSGGGYHTLMAMTMGADYFKAGIAGAAVSDFRFYDTIWTERYMDTPQQNPEGYKKTSVMTYADKFKGKLLIVHGTTDDNVHWQNVIVLMNEFIRLGKQFDTMLYPDRRHGVSDPIAQRHLFTLMTNFIIEKL
jgi:dipeptidyl-peptidase-4